MWGPTLMTVIIISQMIDMTGADDFVFEITYDVNGPIHAEVGTTVTIGCSFNYPDPRDFIPQSVRWYKCDEAICSPSDMILDSGNVNAGQDEFKGRVSLLEPDVTQKNASLVIRAIRLADIGSYQLELVGRWTHNGEFEYLIFHNKKPINVTGLAQPLITGKTSVRGGDTLTLTCQAESSPPSVITWTKAGSHVPLAAGTQRANLVIPNATDDHSGRYTCTAEHVLKRLSDFTTVTVFEKCPACPACPACPSPTFFSNPGFLTNFSISMALIGVHCLALIAWVWKTCHRRPEKTCTDQVEMVTQQTGESPPAVDGAEDTQPKALVGVGETSSDGDVPVPATPPI